MSTAAPFTALGAGNGFTFCRRKRPSSASERPVSMTDINQSMAWYWLLKDFTFTMSMRSFDDPLVYSGDITFQFRDFFAPFLPSFGPGLERQINDIGMLYSGSPAGRASLDGNQEYELRDGRLSVHAYSNNFNQVGIYTTTGNIWVDNEAPFDSFADLHIEWYDDDSCAVTFLFGNGYHFLALTNLPVNSTMVSGFGDSPTSIGTVDTEYGTLTGYDCSDNSGFAGAEVSVTGFTFTSSFYTFG